MREFKISFIATEVIKYTTSVEAETPKQAKKLFEENPSNFDWKHDCIIDSGDKIKNIKIEGEWIQDENSKNSFTLKKWKQPNQNLLKRIIH